jgi:hypothetical protein
VMALMFLRSRVLIAIGAAIACAAYPHASR